MRMLLIAPDQLSLNWSAEIELLGAAVHAVPLTGRVSAERVTRATSGERFRVLHIVAHGDDAGVALSDGLLDKERLAQIARHIRADLVFLNACRSAALGQYLACSGVPAVICYTRDVLDGNALRAASYFYEELVASSLDYRRAFEKVNPCDGSFAWFAGAGYIERAVEPLVSLVGGLQQELVTMRRTMVRALAILAAVNLLAMGVLLSIALPAAYGQTVPPSPLGSPLGTPTPTPTPKRDKEDDDDETATATAMPTERATATASDTPTPPPTALSTRTPTPPPTVVLPTLTPDYLATMSALPPCDPSGQH
jgi:hypothetical protein